MVYAKDGLIIKPIPAENDFNMFVRFKIISSESIDDRDLTVTLGLRSRIQKTTKSYINYSKTAEKIRVSEPPDLRLRLRLRLRPFKNKTAPAPQNKTQTYIHTDNTHERGHD